MRRAGQPDARQPERQGARGVTAPIATIAAQEFHRRREALAKAVRAGTISPEAANDNARLWLAIAGKAGADLPEIAVPCIWPEGRIARLEWFELAERAEILAELARARDAALRKACAEPQNLAALQRGWDLQCLAIHLGAPAPEPELLRGIEPVASQATERKAA